MSRLASSTRLPLRVLAAVFGLLLLGQLIRRAGPATLVHSIGTLRWGLVLVLALAGVSHLVKCWAWRLTLLEEKRRISFTRMLQLRLASEAVGQLGILGQVFGETLRVSLLNPAVPAAARIASVTLDRGFFILSSVAVTMAGMIAVVAVLRLPPHVSMIAKVLVVGLLGVLILAAVAVKRRWGVFSGTARALTRTGFFSEWLMRKHSAIEAFENRLLDFYHKTPRAFWGSFALNMVCHGLAIGEVYLILWLLGVRASAFGALAIEALTKLVNVVGVVNPGNIGTYEGGNMLIAKSLGLGGGIGLTLAIVRRLRALFWGALGSLCLVALPKSKGHDGIPRAEIPASSPKPQSISGASRRSHVAVILANRMPSALARVGSLPVLLRIILRAQKAGAARIVVVVDRPTEPRMIQEMRKTGRLPASVEWYEAGTNEASIPSILQKLSGGENYVALIAGDRIYHPSLHQRAAEWNGEGGALAFRTGSRLAGIYLLSAEQAAEVVRQGPAMCDTIEELDAWLVSRHDAATESVSEDHWQQILTAEDHLTAERKLDRWLVKPTDGLFARMNRRVSIPISRAAIHYPITPNMVTFFTLGVSFLAGLFFALGGYVHMLLGAALSLFASILDGSDGEVARLTLQESEFGCWLETVCDYLYYLFIFAGMTIGLVRTTGMRGYLAWGGLLVFGAISSFLVIGWQRHRLASKQPERYLEIWQSKASKRRNNPFLFLGRHVEFIIRRCFLPYAFLAFAVFNATKLAFIAAAVGANVVWLIALYSYVTFAATPRRAPASA